jgi:tetratricopeptide (TPR) repeat protein
VDDFRKNPLRKRKRSLVEKNMRIQFKNTCFALVITLAFLQPVFSHPSSDVQSGIECLKAGKLEDAEGDFQKARFQDPENPGILYNLGIVNYEKREFQKAATFFAKAVELTGSESERKNGLYNLGNSLFRFGDYEQAIGAYKQVLEISKDERAEYNLKVAEEKLAKRQEEQKKKQQQNESQQNGDQNQQQNGDQKQDGKESKDGQSQNQSGDQQQNQSGDQKNEPGKDKDGQNKEGKDGQQQHANSGDQEKKEQKDGSSQKPGEDKKGDKDKDGKQGDGEQKEQERNREMVKMDESGKKKPDKPQASQRARALKNRKFNPYMIEKLLKQMQEREKEAQRYYRQEPNRRQELDPFRMSPSELRDFMRGKRPQKENKDPNAQDW